MLPILSSSRSNVSYGLSAQVTYLVTPLFREIPKAQWLQRRPISAAAFSQIDFPFPSSRTQNM
jgi:hypothetical protein